MKPQANLAFVFPGQGSQSLGMLAGLAAQYPSIEKTFAEASDALQFDLWKLCQDGPMEQLNQTEHTQPALLAAGVALWRLWRQKNGPAPARLAGHSLGEYTALVAAESLEFKSAVKLVAERGRQMQAAVPAGEGAMAAIIGLDDTTVETICDEAAEEGCVSAANYNAPGQVVIAGDEKAVERAMARAKDQGAKRVLRLPVSVPSHCALMQPAADALAGTLATIPIRSPRIPVLHNVDARAHNEPETICAILLQQLHQPVRWTKTIQAMIEAGITQIIECGPGKVLSGLVRRVDRRLGVFSIEDSEVLNRALHETRPAA